MTDPAMLGAFIRWLFKGCKTNLLKEYENGKWFTDALLGYILIILLFGIMMILIKYGIIN